MTWLLHERSVRIIILLWHADKNIYIEIRVHCRQSSSAVLQLLRICFIYLLYSTLVWLKYDTFNMNHAFFLNILFSRTFTRYAWSTYWLRLQFDFVLVPNCITHCRRTPRQQCVVAFSQAIAITAFCTKKLQFDLWARPKTDTCRDMVKL